ncbi:phosphatidylinositol-binding protein scs2 [Vermiconidia calcicola]|uniref:Phosphatidylinositol-binding protein scs2 n=1 Tax=Vermiconidia calcicola TaxID=1690605 RepID=A0ACC3MCX4_9PEZI|nr:phosphatidylinositol-binding protein scs2 [Vermiconidia calcicola]
MHREHEVLTSVMSGPFTHEVSQVLRLSNPNSDPVAFKVKTTAPKQYCVRPNSGRIEPSRSVEVQVLLQAMKEDPPPDAKCRDKFLVQSVAVLPGTDSGTVSQIWANIEQTAKSSIQERKIRVTFLPPDGEGSSGMTNGLGGGAGSVAGGSQYHEDSEQPPACSSPSSPAGQSAAAVTPQRSSNMNTSATSPSADRSIPADDSTMGGGSSSTGLPTSQDDMKQQLAEAQATIQRLQGEAAEGLRQRKPQEMAQKAVSSVQQSMQNAPAPGGVPVQYTAALCLVCFLLAYLFF